MPGPVELPLGFGREAFGTDPAGYHRARPAYPAATWLALRQCAGLAAGTDVLEIGAGTGLATGPLLAHEPARLLAIEPDARLASYLVETLPDPRLKILQQPFELVALGDASFDLAVSATAFHWLDAIPALNKIRMALRPGGAVALVWNVFGDPQRHDEFHEATIQLFADHAISPSAGGNMQVPHALQSDARRDDFLVAGLIPDEPEYIAWTLSLDAEGIRGLYASFSNVTVLPHDERGPLLDALAETAAVRFGGQVERNMVTAIHIARRGID
ncbi:MAG: class I SAM-dependent methyltransferase [Devosia sp.]